jgi:hypothetical protein
VDHADQSGGVERSIDGKGLAGVGLDGRDVQALQAPGGVIENVRIRVEQGDGTALRQAGAFQEVASPRSHVKVPGADVSLVSFHQNGRRAPPHDPGEKAEDHGIVDLEEERGVLALARVGGIVTLHRSSAPSSWPM